MILMMLKNDILTAHILCLGDKMHRYVFYDGQWQFKPQNVKTNIYSGITQSRCQLQLLMSKLREFWSNSGAHIATVSIFFEVGFECSTV